MNLDNILVQENGEIVDAQTYETNVRLKRNNVHPWTWKKKNGKNCRWTL